MVNKYHSKTNRFCQQCSKRHPTKRPCSNHSIKKNPILKHRGKMLNGYRKVIKNTEEYHANLESSLVANLESSLIREWMGEEAHKKRGTMRVATKASHLYDPILPKKKPTPKPPNTQKGECPICLEDKNLTLLGCRHGVCRPCQDAMVANTGCQDQCPLCRVPMYNTEPVDYLCEYGWPLHRGQRQYTLHKLNDEGFFSFFDLMVR